MQGLISSTYLKIGARILTRLEQDPKLTLQTVVDECNRIISMRYDSTKTEEKVIAHAHYLKIKIVQKKNKQIIKPNPCHSYAGIHFKSDCPF